MSRDEQPRRRSSGDDEPRRRDRDDDRGSRDRGRDDDRGGRGRDRDDDRGGRTGRDGRSYSYQARDKEQTRRRSEQSAGDFDKFLSQSIKMWKPNDGQNAVRILPPTWDKPDHFGHDIYVHYGVGPDRQSYLCLNKMKGEKCPICEERAEAQRAGDEKLAKDLEPKRRVLVYLIDRDHEKDGPQAWSMPWTVDRDIAKISTDRRTGEVLPIDHPEDGYDVFFEKKGAKDRTEYLAPSLDRRDSRLGKQEWLDFAIDNPLPDQLVYFDYDHILKSFSGGGSPSRSRDDDDDRGRGRGHDDDRGGSSRGRDRGNTRDDDDRGRASRSRDEPSHSWEDIHDMTSSELDAMADDNNINPTKYGSDAELADAICDKLGITKKPARREPDRDRDADEPRRRRDPDEDDEPRRRRPADDEPNDDERLARMRRSRGD